jgi:hypothetical protein
VRHLLKKLGLEEWIRKIPGLEPRTKGGFPYRAILDVAEYCVRYLVCDRGMNRREAIREITRVIWGKLSESGRTKTSINEKTFATHMEELLRPLQRREITIKLLDPADASTHWHSNSFCFSLFAGEILLPRSTTWQKIPWLPSTVEGKTWYYCYVDASPLPSDASSMEIFSAVAGIRFEERPSQ